MKKIYTIALSVLSFTSFSQNHSNGIKAIAPQFNQASHSAPSDPLNTPTQRNCGTMEYLQKMIDQNPSLAQHREQEKIRLNNFVQNNYESLVNERTTYVIPTVVHIVYNGAAQNISDAQVLSQITALNKDYRKLNFDLGSVPSAFTSFVADVGIEFCLATRDPQGNPTTGITRTATTESGFTTDDNVKFNNTGGKNAWPTDQYLNIWVCNFSGNLLGYAQFPASGSPSTDGVAIGYKNFGTTGAAIAPFNLGRTATHEVGHWLGLYHIWGDEAACAQDDGVADTPQQKDKNYGCPNFPQGSSQAGGSCNGSSPGSMFMNYMDYVDDGCMHMFTNGQKANMVAALTQQRAPLLTSQGCAGTIPNPNTCDSITNVANSATLQLYSPADMQSQGSGWISGTNSFNDLAKADKYTASTTQQIKGLWVFFGYLYSPGSGNTTVAYKVWNNNGTNGYPNSVLGTQTTTILNIYNNIVANPARPTYVQFPSSISHSGSFYAGIEFDPSNGDTIAVVTNTQNLTTNTAWEKWSNNVWYPYNDPDSWNTQLSHLMWPVLCTPSTVNNKELASNQFDLELFPNPANNELFMSISNNAISHEPIKLRILNMVGQQLINKNIISNNSTISIETSDLANGLYIIELTQNDKLSVKKFQINH